MASLSANPVPGSETTDIHDLAQFGYKQELKRSLNVYSSFAVAFSYISPSTGIFTLYALGLATGGPFFIWSWPIVALGQIIVALNFAEVSSHFPLAGSVYQWTKYLANRPYSWMSGWIYLFAGILTVTAVDVTLPIVVIPLIQNLGWNIPNTTGVQITIAAITLIATTLLNIFGVRLVSIVNNTGVVFEILGMVVFAAILLLFHHHQSASVIFDTAGTEKGSPYLGTFMAAMFMSLFVIYGFDTASTLAEETHNPRAMAPRAVLASVVGALVIGGFFLFSTLIAIPNVKKEMAGSPPVDIITTNLPGFGSNLYLFVVAAAIFVCCLSIQASTIRLCFGMARDRKLPFSGLYNTVHADLHTPIGACIIIAVLAALPLFYYAGAGTIAIGATGMIYLSYLMGNLAILVARTKGWPSKAAPFKLGTWGMVINLLAILWGGSMLINFLWPRGASNPGLNAFSTSFTGALGNVPIFEATLLVIVVVGAIYYLVAQREEPISAPTTGKRAAAR